MTDKHSTSKIEVLNFIDLMEKPVKLEPHEKPRRVARLEHSTDQVKVKGDALHEIWWQGRQWAVTAYGVEARDGCYPIEAHRLAEQDGVTWPEHMSEKVWVDIDDFTTAWLIGLTLHGKEFGGFKTVAPVLKRLRKPGTQS